MMPSFMALTETQTRSLTPDQLIDLIIEEAAEVIQAASKVRRFGHTNGHKDYHDGAPNFFGVLIEGLQLERAMRHYAAKHGARHIDLIDRLECLSDADFTKAYPDNKLNTQ